VTAEWILHNNANGINPTTKGGLLVLALNVKRARFDKDFAAFAVMLHLRRLAAGANRDRDA